MRPRTVPIKPITLTPMQMAWLKSGVDHGPSALVMDGVASSLMRKGCMFKQPDGKFAVTDLGRQVVNADRGLDSTLEKV